MAAATVSYGTLSAQRGPIVGQLSAIRFTVTASTTAYATASGGLPFDLFALLASAGPYEAPLNYKDIVGILPLGLSTNGFLPTGFTLGTTTSTTCPVTCRLVGTGSGNAAALAEFGDGNNSDSFTALLLIQRGGTN